MPGKPPPGEYGLAGSGDLSADRTLSVQPIVESGSFFRQRISAMKKRLSEIVRLFGSKKHGSDRFAVAVDEGHGATSVIPDLEIEVINGAIVTGFVRDGQFNVLIEPLWGEKKRAVELLARSRPSL